MRAAYTSGGFEVEWEESDLSPLLGSSNLLMAVAAANANYYAMMIRYRYASDDDTDYINSHSECMLAANALWMDDDPVPMVNWLNVWANWVGDLSEVQAFSQQHKEAMIEYIVRRIAA